MDSYPVTLSIDYPDRPLNRLTTAFRVFTVIPIAIVLGSIAGYTNQYDASGGERDDRHRRGRPALRPATAHDPVPAEVPALVVRLEPRAAAFANRVGAYFALMEDRYPSTDEHQYVALEMPYPDARTGLNRWLPLVKWFLAIPHLIVLAFLYLGVIVVVIIAWFAILFTGRARVGSSISSRV